MSLYNALFGQNPASDLLLAIVGLTRADVGRFRDCYVDTEGEALRIAVYTRNGGGNREHYNDEKEPGESCGCTGCIITERLPQHPLYISDSDDEFDCTYATILFRVPDFAIDLLREHAKESPAPREKWDALFAKLREPDAKDADVARAMKVGESIFGKLEAALRGEGSPIVTVDGSEGSGG